jgi:hypothetical protein
MTSGGSSVSKVIELCAVRSGSDSGRSTGSFHLYRQRILAHFEAYPASYQKYVADYFFGSKASSYHSPHSARSEVRGT